MSIQMAAARIVLRATLKPRAARASLAVMREGAALDPPEDVAAAHVVTEGVVAGSRVVWLDRERRDAGVVVFLHGGGYVSGPFPPQWRWVSALIAPLGVAGLVVDYPLAPEHPHPAALDAATAALRHAACVTDGPCVLAGDSAGGGLAIAVAARLRDEGLPMPASLVLVSPWLDLEMTDEEMLAAAGIDCYVSVPALRRSARAYAPGRDLREPSISPLFGDPAGLPPTLLHVGTHELVLREARAWARRCEEAGTDCRLVVIRGGFHGTPLAGPRFPEARAALREQRAHVVAAIAR